MAKHQTQGRSRQAAKTVEQGRLMKERCVEGQQTEEELRFRARLIKRSKTRVEGRWIKVQV